MLKTCPAMVAKPGQPQPLKNISADLGAKDQSSPAVSPYLGKAGGLGRAPTPRLKPRSRHRHIGLYPDHILDLGHDSGIPAADY